MEMDIQTWRDRAFLAALRMNRRRDFNLVAGSEGFALKDWGMAFARVRDKAEALLRAGASARAMYREFVVQARLIQLAELENLAKLLKSERS